MYCLLFRKKCPVICGAKKNIFVVIRNYWTSQTLNWCKRIPVNECDYGNSNCSRCHFPNVIHNKKKCASLNYPACNEGAFSQGKCMLRRYHSRESAPENLPDTTVLFYI